MKMLLITLLLANLASGVTREVVQVFQPLSFHFTDTAAEFGPKGDLVQANVISRPMVLSGAFPEDLAKAVTMSCRLDSNNPTYDIEEVNLAKLCGLTLEASRLEETVEIVIDCSKAKVPEEIEVGLDVVLQMMVECIRRTLRVYYQESGHRSFQCEVSLSGVGEGNERWKDFASRFQVGSAHPEEPASEAVPEVEVVPEDEAVEAVEVPAE